MQLISILVTACVLLQQSTVAQPWYPAQDAVVKGPNFAVEQRDSQLKLIIKGETAKLLLQHLDHPLVVQRGRFMYQQKRGFGIICSKRLTNAGYLYRCEQNLSAEGIADTNLAFSPELKSDAKLLSLTLRGPSLAKLFDALNTSVNVNDSEDGSLEVIKASSAITCTQLIDPAQQSSYRCEQLISSGGYLRGIGTDPMIGAGTLPVSLQADE